MKKVKLIFLMVIALMLIIGNLGMSCSSDHHDVNNLTNSGAGSGNGNNNSNNNSNNPTDNSQRTTP